MTAWIDPEAVWGVSEAEVAHWEGAEAACRLFRDTGGGCGEPPGPEEVSTLPLFKFSVGAGLTCMTWPWCVAGEPPGGGETRGRVSLPSSFSIRTSSTQFSPRGFPT